MPSIKTLMILATILFAGASACNECDFTERRCNGDIVEQCGEDDQVIGRSVMQMRCEGLNPVCVQQGDDAFCAVSREKSCAVDSPARCDGDVQVQCKSPGVEVATDCRSIRILSGGNLVPAGYRCVVNDCR